MRSSKLGLKDAKVIVGLLNLKKNPNSAYAPLLSDCKYLLGKLPQVRVSHVFREPNKFTDQLAKWDCAMEEDFAVFEFPFTAKLETLVAKDNNGLYYTRLAALETLAAKDNNGLYHIRLATILDQLHLLPVQQL